MLTNDLLTIDGAELYFPYSENFTDNVDQINYLERYTVSSAPIDNANENYGIVWNYDENDWDDVLVNDDYAYTHPTFLVTIDDGPPLEERITGLSGGIPIKFLPDIIENDPNPTPPPFINPTPIEGSRVYFGRFHLEEQADGLFDGASEIRLIRPSVTPTFDVNGNLLTTNVSIEEYFQLPKIRRKKVKEMKRNHDVSIYVGASFSNEWKPVNASLPLVIYEYDQGSSLDISLPTLSIKTKIFGQDVTITTPSALKYTVTSKSKPYVVENIPRSTYGYYRNIKNPGIDPGIYNGWRSWGIQGTNVTLVTEGGNFFPN